jgi:hypothetical protein
MACTYNPGVDTPQDPGVTERILAEPCSFGGSCLRYRYVSRHVRSSASWSTYERALMLSFTVSAARSLLG